MTVNTNTLLSIKKDLSDFPKSKLLIVSKNRSIDDIRYLLEAGYIYFGENRVQEALNKFPDKVRMNYQSLNLHLIGPLQSNKANQALKLFDTIQTIDRKKIVDVISKEMSKNSYLRTREFYLQVNIGLENQKSGVNPEIAEELYHYAVKKNLNIIGLMCIPPVKISSEIYFQKMIVLKNKINKKLLLSMGMSSDYLIALKNGSDMVRVGSKIFE